MYGRNGKAKKKTKSIADKNNCGLLFLRGGKTEKRLTLLKVQSSLDSDLSWGSIAPKVSLF